MPSNQDDLLVLVCRCIPIREHRESSYDHAAAVLSCLLTSQYRRVLLCSFTRILTVDWIPQRLPCTFLLEVPNLGHLEGTNDRDVGLSSAITLVYLVD